MDTIRQNSTSLNIVLCSACQIISPLFVNVLEHNRLMRYTPRALWLVIKLMGSACDVIFIWLFNNTSHVRPVNKNDEHKIT